MIYTNQVSNLDQTLFLQKELSLCHKLKFLYVFVISDLDFLTLVFEISQVYVMGLQIYRDWKTKVCD